MVIEERREDVTKIPRPYVLSIVGIIVVLLTSLVATIYSTATNTWRRISKDRKPRSLL
jgi:hypothetical protein